MSNNLSNDIRISKKAWVGILNAIRKALETKKLFKAYEVPEKINEMLEVEDSLSNFLKGEKTDIYYSGEILYNSYQFNANANIKKFEAPNLTFLPSYTFYSSNLRVVKCESVTTANATQCIFDICKYLEEVYMPNLGDIGGTAMFRRCVSLKRLELPSVVTASGYQAIYGCSSLESVVLMSCNKINGGQLLDGCNSLKELVIGTPNCTLSNGTTILPSNFLEQGAIFVPDDAVDWYKTATNWSNYADIIRPMSEREIYLSGLEFPKEYLKTLQFISDKEIKNFAVNIPDNVSSLANCFESARNISNIVLKKENGVNITNLSNAFSYQNGKRNIDIQFDTSKVTNYYRMCHRIGVAYSENCQVVITGNIDFSSATNVQQMFDNMGSFSCQGFVPNSLSISWKPGAVMADDDTRQSVIDCLAPVEEAKTLTVTETDGLLFTEEQIASATAKNWTIAY